MVENSNFRVLFLYPNTMMATLLPINISLLHAVLRKEGYQTKLFDTTFYRTEEINFEMKKVELLQIKKFDYKDTGVKFKDTDIIDDLRTLVDEYQPDLIAVTIVEDTFELARQLIEAVKDRSIPIIAGGVFVTFNPDEVLAVPGVTIACIGEGEEPLTELCNALAHGLDYSGIRNLYIKTENGVIRNSLRPPVVLDNLPYIDYDLFEKERMYRPMQGKIYPMLHVEIDRGCPYGCTYCGAELLKRIYQNETGEHYYRQKSVRRIIDEMQYLVKKYNPGYINFNSETFLARPVEELIVFADLYKETIGLPFWCQSRPETITREKISLLHDMGCKNLQIGIESGNEEFRKRVLRRNYSNDQLKNAFALIEEQEIEYTVNNIIGFPDETRGLIFDTIQINRDIHPVTMNVNLFTPYKGTALYEYCIDKGYLSPGMRVNQLLDSVPLRSQPLSYTQLKGLQRTFPLYARFPESEYPRIRVAEKLDEEGDEMFDELRKEFYETVFHLPYDSE